MLVSNASMIAQSSTAMARYLRFCFDQLSSMMQQADVNVRGQLAQVGVSADPEVRASLGWHDYERLICHLDSRAVLPGAGLDVGRQSSTGEFGPLGIISTCASTYGESMQLGVRYAHLIGWDVKPELHRDIDGWNHVRICSRASGGPLPRALVEQWCALVWRSMAWLLLDAELARAEFMLPFERPQHAGKYEETFNCPVAFSSRWAGFRYPSEWDDLPLPEQNSAIAAACLSQLQLMDRAPVTVDTLVNRIRTQLAAQIHEGLPTMDRIARQIGQSVPTLRRRLSGAGLTYEKVVEGYRRELACNLLMASQLQIEQIAAALGYRSPSSFYSAFRDWYGCSPRVYRSLHRDRRREALAAAI